MKKDDIKVSVIIPAYNAECFLDKCLESLVNQSLKEIEIIVIDDGSSDGTKDIILKYQKNYPNIVAFFQENKGVSAARNLGMSAAKGEFIGFVDADDTVDVLMYEKMYWTAVEENADIIQCGRYEVTANDMKIFIPKSFTIVSDIFEMPEILSKQTLFVWDKLYKRSILEQNNINFDENIHYAEDFIFLFEYEMSKAKFVTIDEPLYYYLTKRDGATTSAYTKVLLDNVIALKVVNEMALRNGYFNQFEGALWRVEAHYYLRRIRDFKNYSDKKLQKAIAKEFFALFDYYFWNWRKTICRIDTKNRFLIRLNCYRSYWFAMLLFIYCPNFLKKGVYCWKVIIKTCKKKLKDFRKKCEDRKFSIKYAKYSKKPIDNESILLVSYYGSNFNDSIYYLAKDLLERENLKVYIGSNNLHRDTTFIRFNEIDVRLVKTFSDEYLRLLATAKYLVCNSRFPSFFSKREGQIYLNTWHGTPLKTLGKYMETGLKDVGNNQGNFLMSDYLLYPNEYTFEKMTDSFFLNDLYTGTVLLSGYPRNSVFFTDVDTMKIKRNMGLLGKKIYAYMPTWRGKTIDAIAVEKYKNEILELLDIIDSQLNDDIVLFVKLHQLVMRKIKLGHYKHIMEFHPFYETYTFLNIADCLITDYSSIFFDFANTKKEIILFTYDYEEYISERGLYFDIDTLPFKRINDVFELVDFMNDSKKEFVCDSKYTEFLQQYCKHDSAQVNKKINDTILTGNIDKDLKIISYEKNKSKKFDIYIISNLVNSADKEQFIALTQTVRLEKSIFVFLQWSFEKETNDTLRQYADSDLIYVVAPGEMPFTYWEGVILVLYRKLKIFKRKAKKIYSKELKRILPGIQINSIKNYSDDRKFIDISELLGEHSCKK